MLLKIFPVSSLSISDFFILWETIKNENFQTFMINEDTVNALEELEI